MATYFTRYPDDRGLLKITVGSRVPLICTEPYFLYQQIAGLWFARLSFCRHHLPHEFQGTGYACPSDRIMGVLLSWCHELWTPRSATRAPDEVVRPPDHRVLIESFILFLRHNAALPL